MAFITDDLLPSSFVAPLDPSEGRALTNAIGNSVATIVIAKWQGELDKDKFHEALREPSGVERATDRALAGAAPA